MLLKKSLSILLVIFSVFVLLSLITLQDENRFRRTKNLQNSAGYNSDLLTGRDLYFYMMVSGRKLYLSGGGVPKRDDGLQRKLIFDEGKRNLRILRLTLERTNEPDPDNYGRSLYQVSAWMKDTFNGAQISGILVASLAGPVVDTPTIKRPENRMQYFWRVIQYGDGFALVNLFQKSNRRLGIENTNSNAKTVQSRWSDPKQDSSNRYILPLYWEN